MFQWMLERDFMPHGHCYYWRPDILWTHVAADTVIALAYFSIPLTLLHFARQGGAALPLRGVVFLFAAFIVLCGATHIMSIVTVWSPVYGLEGLVKAATAAVSIVTALALIPLVPAALTLKSRAQLETANHALAVEVERRREAERRLEQGLSDLHRSNRELEQFARLASDDLKSPVQDIVGLAGLLKKESGGQLSAVASGYVEQIEKAGWRMHKLINDQLGRSRPHVEALT